jgi:hypothetical protein
MRRVVAALGICVLLTCPWPLAATAAEEGSIADDTALLLACRKLAADPFAGTGPDEWSRPFQSIDPFKSIPVCREALRRHPGDPGLMLAASFAYLAGRKNEQARPLLERLVAQNNADAMLALSFISKGPEATDLLRRAAERGNASGMMLFGMTQLLGKGVPKDQLAGVRTLRRAAEAGSTRAMLLLASFYYKGDYGVGYNRAEAKRLLADAAGRGDRSAKEELANFERNEAFDAANKP